MVGHRSGLLGLVFSLVLLISISSARVDAQETIKTGTYEECYKMWQERHKD